MKITVIAVGKLKEKFWTEACAEYSKRLTRYVDLKIIEIADRDPSKSGGEIKAMQVEGQDIVHEIDKISCPADRYVVCLEIDGKQLSSEQFAKSIEQKSIEGCKDFIFVIGGSTGIDKSICAMANASMSFGKITLPHNLARVVLLEQIYRAFRIIKGQPYHK